MLAHGFRLAERVIGGGERRLFAARQNFADHRRGEVGQRGEVVVRPAARLPVDYAEAADDHASGQRQRNPGESGDSQFKRQAVIAHERVLARVADDQRAAGGDDVLPVGIIERKLTLRRPGFVKPHLAFQKLAVLIQQRDAGDRRLEDAAGEPGQAVERRLRRGVQQVEILQGGEAFRTGDNFRAGVGHQGLARFNRTASLYAETLHQCCLKDRKAHDGRSGSTSSLWKSVRVTSAPESST
ncbi:MAG: hypothetical protein U0703_02140 [Anaerolineae bacterium]